LARTRSPTSKRRAGAAVRARGDTDAGGEGFTAASRALGESCFSIGGFGYLSAQA
jgi:hypothetical protein